jgi:hypothetical protein
MTAPFSVTQLAQELETLHHLFADRPVRLREVIERTEGRILDLLLIFLSIPFIQPIPIPISTAIGPIMIIMGYRMALGLPPWLPQRLLEVQLPPKFFGMVLRGAQKLLKILNYVLHPRWPLLSSGPACQIHGGIIVLAGLIFTIPFPPVAPFTNSFPAWTILFLSAGMLARDGLFIIIGHLTFITMIGYFIFLGHAFQKLFETIQQWLT